MEPPVLDPGDIPNFVVGPDALLRWRLCVGLTRLASGGSNDGMFTRALFFSKVPTEGEDLSEGFDPNELRDPLGQWTKGALDSWASKIHRRDRERAIPKVSEEEMRQRGFDDKPVPGPKAREILGDARDTAELYRGGTETEPQEYRYSTSRLAEHDVVVHALTDGHEHQDHPHILVVLGGPASGKSEFLQAFPELPVIPDDAARLNADDVRDQMGEFRQMADAGDPYAAAATHREAGDVVKKAYDRAVERRLNIVLDQTGDGDEGLLARELSEIHDKGYAVDVVYVDTPVSEAVRRNLVRAVEDKRYVPNGVLREKHRIVSKRFRDEISHLSWLSSLNVFDDDGLIGTMRNGAMVPTKPERYDAFVSKADAPREPGEHDLAGPSITESKGGSPDVEGKTDLFADGGPVILIPDDLEAVLTRKPPRE